MYRYKIINKELPKANAGIYGNFTRKKKTPANYGKKPEGTAAF
jgi:hypothetical protein